MMTTLMIAAVNLRNLHGHEDALVLRRVRTWQPSWCCIHFYIWDFFFFYGFAKSHFIFMNYPPENRRSNCCVARKVSGNRQDCKFEPN